MVDFVVYGIGQYHNYVGYWISQYHNIILYIILQFEFWKLDKYFDILVIFRRELYST